MVKSTKVKKCEQKFSGFLLSLTLGLVGLALIFDSTLNFPANKQIYLFYKKHAIYTDWKLDWPMQQTWQPKDWQCSPVSFFKKPSLIDGCNTEGYNWDSLERMDVSGQSGINMGAWWCCQQQKMPFLYKLAKLFISFSCSSWHKHYLS